MHLDRDERLDLTPVAAAELAEHHRGERVEPRHHLRLVVLERALVALLEPLEGRVDLARPPDLRGAHLVRVSVRVRVRVRVRLMVR